ncbi:hypothetical protein SAMN05192541_12284 [Bradyrhizobium arachidis]|nr:hypothetical protein SAMN05192541_12284 [Bradyrhizobium arachidis]
MSEGCQFGSERQHSDWHFHRFSRCSRITCRLEWFGLAEEWRFLERRVASITKEIDELADQAAHRRRLMSAPGVGPIISSAMIAAIGTVMPSRGTATLQHGLASYRNKSRPAIEPFSAAYRGVATGTSERCSFKGQSRTSKASQLAHAWLRSLVGSSIQAAPLESTSCRLAAKLARLARSMLAKGRDYDANFTGHAA